MTQYETPVERAEQRRNQLTERARQFEDLEIVAGWYASNEPQAIASFPVLREYRQNNPVEIQVYQLKAMAEIATALHRLSDLLEKRIFRQDKQAERQPSLFDDTGEDSE